MALIDSLPLVFPLQSRDMHRYAPNKSELAASLCLP